MGYQSSFMIRYRIGSTYIHPYMLGRLLRELREDFLIFSLGRGEYIIAGDYIIAHLDVNIETWIEEPFLALSMDDVDKEAVVFVPFPECEVRYAGDEFDDESLCGVPRIRFRIRRAWIRGNVVVSVDTQHAVYSPLSELQDFLLTLAKYGVNYSLSLIRSM